MGINDGVQYAMKVLLQSKLNHNNDEANILREFSNYSFNEDESNIIRIMDSFIITKDNDNYYAIVYELCGINLQDYIKENNSMGLGMTQIQFIAKQLLEAVNGLHNKEKIHTNIALENILLKNNEYEIIRDTKEIPENVINNPYMQENLSEKNMKNFEYKKLKYLKIRLSGFSNCLDKYNLKNMNKNLLERKNLAPEVVIESDDIDTKIDIWAIACVLIELYLGNPLFRNIQSDEEHICLMDKAFGYFTNEIFERSKNKKFEDLFTYTYDQNNVLCNVINMDKFKDKTLINDALQKQLNINKIFLPSHKMFKQFILYLMRINKNSRPTAEEALRHEFFYYKFKD